MNLRILNLHTNQVSEEAYRKLQPHEYVLMDNEEYLTHFDDPKYHNPSITLVLTTKQVIAWCWAEDEFNIYATSSYTTEGTSHNDLCNILPDTLHTMVLHYVEASTTQTVEQLDLFNKVMRGIKGKKHARVRKSRK